MTIYTNIHSYPWIKQDFRNGKADIFAIQAAMSQKCLGEDTSPLPDVDKRQGHIDPQTSWWGRDNNRPLDAIEMNRIFHSSPALLQGSEQVEMAFKGRRDIVLFTNKRLLLIDPKGFTGKKTEYTSLPWKSILAFGVETAGKHFDQDAEAKIWTEIMSIPGSGEDNPPDPGMSFLELDFNKKLVDIIAVKKYLSARILERSNALPITPNVFMNSADEKGVEKFFSKIGGDQRVIDPSDINTELHSSVPLLIDGENVVMAFKAGRDLTCFTNRRAIVIDVVGWSGKKVDYLSIPYQSILGFSAESAGGWDRDSEVKIYTRNLWNLKKTELDFRKGKADIIVIQKFLSTVILGNAKDAERYFTPGGGPLQDVANPAGIKNFLSWLTSNSTEEDADATDAQLHSDPPIQNDEKCEKVYKAGRDLYVYTTKRVLLIDVQGLRGKKVEYLNIPLDSCMSFAVETAGHLDRDAEVYIHTQIPGKDVLQQDILVKRGDVMEMHEHLTRKLMFDDK